MPDKDRSPSGSFFGGLRRSSRSPQYREKFSARVLTNSHIGVTHKREGGPLRILGRVFSGGLKQDFGGGFMRQISRPTALAIMAVALGIATLDGEAVWRAARAGGTQGINAWIVAVNIPGASAIAQIGTFVDGGTLDPSPIGKPCANPSPIPTKFPGYTGQGAVLDPNRILVGSRSNFGAPRAIGVGQEGSFLSIDPSGPGILKVPPNFASAGDQASTPGGAVQMFSANSPFWTNSQNNSGANTAKYTGVSDCRRQPDGFRNRALPSLRARVGHPDQLADA